MLAAAVSETITTFVRTPWYPAKYKVWPPMIWRLSDRPTHKRLERAFRNRSIDPTKPGFCDQEAFLRAERMDRRFLETYAAFVEAQAYDFAYLATARHKIDIVANVVSNAIAEDGRLGACVDAAGMVCRMLDRLDVWNYMAKATLTITFGATEHDPEYFWVLDEGNFVASHAIVVAPPYAVVDVTVKHQPYPAAKRVLIPDLVLADEFEPGSWNEEDLASPAVRLAVEMSGYRRVADYVTERYPQMVEVMDVLPARIVHAGQIALKYVPVAVGGVIEPLEGLVGYRSCGKTALQIFENEVVPRLQT